MRIPKNAKGRQQGGWHLQRGMQKIRYGETDKEAVEDRVQLSFSFNDQADERVDGYSHKNY